MGLRICAKGGITGRAMANGEAKMATNQITGGEALVRMLKLHGVNVIFGLCGDTSLPFYDALYRTAGDLTHVLTRDERHAAYMADAYARVTGRVGVCEEYPAVWRDLYCARCC